MQRVLDSHAMVPKVLLLLSVFGAGCLSSALIVAVWRADPGDTASLGKQGADRTTEPLDPPVVATAAAREDAISQAAAENLDASFPTEQGSSVADVLNRLEAAYRQALAAVPANAPAAPDAIAEVSEAPPHDVSAPEQAAVALADLAAPPKDAARADAHSAAAPHVDAEQAVALRDDVQPRDVRMSDVHVGDVHVGDVHQSIHDGNVRQGDVYQLQQLAVLQYFQLLMLSPHGSFTAPARTPRRATNRPLSPFPTSVTNPNNPWGFDIPPPVLVK